MKKFLAFILSAIMLFSVVSCSSAYENYGDYISTDLSKISIEKAKILEKVADQILALREEGRDGFWVKLDDKEAVAQNGDKLNIDFDVKDWKDPDDNDFAPSEETKKGMKSEGYDLVLGSNSFIGAYTVKDDADNIRNNKGFEEQLIGAKVNTNDTDNKEQDDKIEVLVTFPDDYKTKELQGVIVTFVVTVNSISRSTVDLTNKELIASLTYTFVDPDAKDEDSTEGEDNTAGEGNDNVATTDAGDDANEGGETEEDENKVKFEDLFKNSKLEIDFSSEDLGKFNTIFDIKTVFDALAGKNLYDEFEVVFTVPSAEDLKKDENDKEKNDKFEPYAGREITVKFTLNSLTALPEWNDEYVKEQTKNEYESVKAYEEYLNEGYAYEMALAAIIDGTVVNDLPEKEVKTAYKNALRNSITNTIRTEKNADNGIYSTSSSNYVYYEIGNLTQKEYDMYITDEVYAAACEYAAEQAVIAVKTYLVYEYLFDELGIELSNKDYKARIKEAYNPLKDAYKSIGINSQSDYVEYMYGGKDEAIRSLKIEMLNEKKAEIIALVTVVAE